MKSLIFIFLFTMCEGEVELDKKESVLKDVSKIIEGKNALEGIWKSEYNDSIKFISSTEVIINSIFYYYEFGDDSIGLHSLCNDIYCSNMGKYRNYKYELDSISNKFLIYNFKNTFDSLYLLQNDSLVIFSKVNSSMTLGFYEWIQGIWQNQNNETILFSRPYSLESNILNINLPECTDFVATGEFYGGNGLGSLYIFSEDSLRLHSSLSSNLCSYSSYQYKLDITNNQLIIFNYNVVDSSKFIKLKKI